MGPGDEKNSRRCRNCLDEWARTWKGRIRIGICPCGEKHKLLWDPDSRGQLEIRWCFCGRVLSFRPMPNTGATLIHVDGVGPDGEGPDERPSPGGGALRGPGGEGDRT